MNKPVYLGVSVLDISRTLMYKFWFDCIKPKYEDGAKLCYTDTDSLMINHITEDFFEDIADDFTKRFDTSNCDKNDKRPLPMGIKKKVYGFFKDESGGKIMKEFVALRVKTYAYLMDDDAEEKKAKETKKCVIKRELMFKNYKYCLKSQQRFKSNHYKVCTEEVYKIALNSDDDKRLQIFTGVETCSYGTNAFKKCESEMIVVKDLFVKKI